MADLQIYHLLIVFQCSGPKQQLFRIILLSHNSLSVLRINVIYTIKFYRLHWLFENQETLEYICKELSKHPHEFITS